MATGNFSSTIKAIGCQQTGDTDVIDLLDLPFPEHKPDEVLVKVLYAGVNFIDTYQRKGLYPAKSFPLRLGTESSGVVVGLPTDPAVLNDPKYQRLGIHLGGKVAASSAGSLAQYISVPWKNILVLPDSVSPLDACAIFIQGLTALAFMTESHDVKAGETILIHTVAGGFGLLAAQIAKSRGATVIGTTSTEAKAALAKSHGADHVIIYTKEDTVKRVLEITGGKGVDAIYDGVGKDTIDADFEMIKRKGTLVSVGNASGVVPPFPPLRLTPKNIKLLRPTVMNYLVTPDESYYYFTEITKLIQNGTVKVNLHKVYPFTAEGVRQTHIDITGRETTGKLIVQVSEE